MNFSKIEPCSIDPGGYWCGRTMTQEMAHWQEELTLTLTGGASWTEVKTGRAATGFRMGVAMWFGFLYCWGMGRSSDLLWAYTHYKRAIETCAWMWTHVYGRDSETRCHRSSKFQNWDTSDTEKHFLYMLLQFSPILYSILSFIM